MSKKELKVSLTTDHYGNPSSVCFHPENDPTRIAFEIRVVNGSTIEIRAVDMIKAKDKEGKEQVYNNSLNIKPETSNSVRVSLSLYD